MQPEIDFIDCPDEHGGHRLAYAFWDGPRHGSIHMLVHGLSRNGRDFDRLASKLVKWGPVYAPDMPGRGLSDRLADPEDYGYTLYVADVLALIRHVGAGAVDFVGTSMGGIIGMQIAATPNPPVRRLVLNDVGPFIPKAALERIALYVGANPEFDDLADVERHLRHVMASFGPIGSEDWQHFLGHAWRREADGRLALHYDPAIAASFRGTLADVDLWPVYDRIQVPVLVVHGSASDVLLPETVAEMARRGPRASCYEVAEAGHAPALIEPQQIEAIEQFFHEDDLNPFAQEPQ